MIRTNPRLALLSAIVLAVGGVAVFAASSAGGQSEGVVPVDFEPTDLSSVTLHLAREETSSQADDSGSDCTATVQTTSTNDGEENINPLCQMLLRPPEEDGAADPKSERRQVQGNASQQLDAEEDVVRFTLDARPDDPFISSPDRIPQGAEYPFTLRASSSALKTTFFYSTDAVCDEGVPLGAGEQQPIDFHVRYYKVSEDRLQSPEGGEFDDPFATTVVTDCGNAAEQISSQNADRVTVKTGLDSPVTFKRGDAIVTEITAVNSDAADQSLSWEIYFQDDDFESRVDVKTSKTGEKCRAAICQATWATDRSGTQKDTFDPDAQKSDRFLVPNVAFRSAFGGDAIPSATGAYDVQIRDPSGLPVDLVTDDEDTTNTLGLTENEDLRSRAGALKIFEIEHPQDQAQPWHYPANLEPGPYKIEVGGDLVDDLAPSFSRSIAMGAFDFSMEPLDQESTDHVLQPNSSTTFLLNLENQGSETDTYDVSASFEFSEGGSPWAVDLIGVDQNNRVTVDEGKNALLRVKVTPPEDVSLGDRAQVLVSAESASSGATNNLTLESQVSDSTVRETGALVVADEPVPVRLGKTTTIDLFAWNRGTARDGMSISKVPDSTQGAAPENFDVDIGQSEVTGVSPGDVASVPIHVTTKGDVKEGDQFSFEVEVTSRSEPSASATTRILTEVTAERQLEIVGLDHQNEQSQESLRFSRFNRNDTGPGTCEPALRDQLDRPDECLDFHNWTYHRAVVTNTGDQGETVDLSLLPAGDENSLPGRTEEVPENNCDAILPTRLQRMQDERGIDPVQIVGGIDHQDPGSESGVDQVQLDPGESRVVYLRVGYDGSTPWYEDADQTDQCSQESFHATVVASLANGESKSISTETRFPYENTGDMSDDAQARLALLDSYERDDGTLAELPARTGLELGETTTINFTLSMQQAHEDQTRVELASPSKIQDLENEGWNISLKSLDVDAEAESDDGHSIVLPASHVFEDDRSIGHAGGVDYTLGLEVTPPEKGPQQNARESFTVLASSLERPGERDSLDVDTQIGKTFAFDVRTQTNELRAHPGDEVAFGLEVANEGATRDGYDIEATSDSADVVAEPSNPTISSGSEQVSSIRVDVPADATRGSTIEVTASVTAERGTPGDPSDDPDPKEVTFTVNVPQTTSQTLTMEAERSITSVSPGGQSAVDFSITNEQDTPQQIQIVQDAGPPGWDTSLWDADNQEPTPENRTIAGGETITQTVLLQAPDSIVEGSKFPFTIRAQNLTGDDASPNDNFAVATAYAIAQGQTALSLEVETNKTSVVDRGDTTQFPVLVRNPGTSPTTYKLSASFQSEDWLARFVEADTGNVLSNETVTVPENEFRRVLVEVQAPNDVSRGHVEEVTFSAFAIGQRSVQDEVTLEAAIHDFGVDVEVTGGTAKDAAPGDAVPFQVSITNTGNGEDEISLSFKGTESEDPIYPVTSSLTDDTTPTLAPGETLENVTVEVQVPSPDPQQAPPVTDEGITAVIEARSGGDLPSGSVPTATAEVTTRLVEYVINDVDDDTAFEVALDLNRDLDDGYEVFRDQDAQMIERGELNSSQSVESQGLYVVDGDDDGRAEHLIDTDNDGVGNQYFDPDRAQTFRLPFTVDVTGDAQPEHPVDANFDGVIDAVYDPASEELRKAAHLDLSGDGRRDLLVDTTGDTRYNRYVNPHEDPAIVTDVERDGELYKVDTDGSGTVDTHYDVQTQSVQDAETANLQTFLGDYWYVLVVFLAVVVAFGVIFYRQL